MKKEIEITKAFKESLLMNTGGLAAECVDVGLSFVDNPIVQSIPIASLLLSCAKIGVNIYNYWACYSYVRFITKVRAGNVTDKEIEKHLAKLDSPKKLNKELGMIAVYLQKNTAENKADIYASIYISFIKEEITFDDLCELYEVTDRLFVKDISLLNQIGIYGHISGFDQNYQIHRLESLGLIRSQFVTGDIVWQREDGEDTSGFYFTDLGEKFYSFIGK